MTTIEKIQRINQVLHDYFTLNVGGESVPAKQFMNAFIRAGIFSKDTKEGLPIRQLLRSLDKSKTLHLIPFVIPERKEKNTNWYFGPATHKHEKITTEKTITSSPYRRPTVSRSNPRSHSDECYVLDLCDDILKRQSARQHHFPFLLGDPNTKGIRTPLPVDAWYAPVNLVIEFNERQHTEPVRLFDRRMTISGVSRGEQRAIYDRRKLEILPQHGIEILIISYNDLPHDNRKQLIREMATDRNILTAILEKLSTPITF